MKRFGITLLAVGFVGAPSSASADPYRVSDAADYVVWHRKTAESGDLVVAPAPSFTPDGRQLVVTIKDGPRV